MKQEKVWRYIEEERLPVQEGKVIVALSGGADSVALLRLLLEYGCRCVAAHCNFHLRGEESDRDEAFVTRLCQELDTSLHIAHFDTWRTAHERHVSIEMAARELRYEWFEKLRVECGAVSIAVAHHADDSIETFLLNLIRGTGIDGLRGIRPRNGQIIRPLLCLSRKDILEYLESIGQTYMTDSTNLADEFTRNKIRLHLLPLLESINPSVRRNILQAAKHLDDAAFLYHRAIDEGKQRIWDKEGISIPALKREAVPGTLLYEALRSYGFNSTQVHDILQSMDGQAGKTFASARTRIVKDRDHLFVEDLAERFSPPLLYVEKLPYNKDFILPRDKDTACLDAGKLTSPLALRRWQKGDAFVPFGMSGRKKVSDYLTDRKFSLTRKDRQWVLCCGKEIAWLVGERLDNRFRVNKTTKQVVLVKAELCAAASLAKE